MKVLRITHIREECFCKNFGVWEYTAYVERLFMSLYQWSWDNFIQKDIWREQCRGKLVFSDLGRRTATAALRRGTRNKESRTARVKSTMFIVTYTIMCNTHPHKITETFVMLMLVCHCHLQISRHNHFKEWPWTGWRLDLTPKKAPERETKEMSFSSVVFQLTWPSHQRRVGGRYFFLSGDDPIGTRKDLDLRPTKTNISEAQDFGSIFWAFNSSFLANFINTYWPASSYNRSSFVSYVGRGGLH